MDDSSTVTLAPPVELPVALRVLRRFEFPRKLGALEKIFGDKLARLGVVNVATHPGLNWKLDLADPCHRWIVYGDYEGPSSWRWIRNWLSEGGVVIDSGANIGQTLLYFLAMENTHVLAFEPYKHAADWIQNCVVHNNMQDRVSLIRKGLFSESGTQIFQIAEDESNHGAWTTLQQNWYVDKNFERQQLEVVSLDDFLGEQQIDDVRFWKLDVEGAEYDVLLGAERAIAARKIGAIYVELASTNALKTIKFMRQYGYQACLINNKSKAISVVNPDSLTVGVNMVLFK